MKFDVFGTYHYTAAQSGSNLRLLGAQHGNETCGPEAQAIVYDLIAKEIVTLRKGSLDLKPVSNKEAFRRNVRLVADQGGIDFNRFMHPIDALKQSEHFDSHPEQSSPQFGALRDTVLFVEGRSGDRDKPRVLLDTHSQNTSETDVPYAIQKVMNEGDLGRAHDAFTAALGFPITVMSISEIFDAGNDTTDGTATALANMFGSVALTIECKNHKDLDSAPLALLASSRAMLHWGQIDEEGYYKALAYVDHADPAYEDLNGIKITDLDALYPRDVAPRRLWVERKEVVPVGGGQFVDKFDTFEELQPGQPIFKGHDGSELKVPEYPLPQNGSWHMFLPKYEFESVAGDKSTHDGKVVYFLLTDCNPLECRP